MPHGAEDDICESCNGPLGDDAPLYEDADICRTCHNEIQGTEPVVPVVPINIAICKMPDWV